MNSLCGYDCTECTLNDSCKGCSETEGRPFGGECVVAECVKKSGSDAVCQMKQQLIDEFNALGIPDMGTVTELNALLGAYINCEYKLPSGQSVKLWDDGAVCLGNQLPKQGSDRCYGIAADERFLMVSEYGENGTDAEIVLLKRRR